ncbi:hypothetical protein FXO37_30561 [Capsicum annuum]|nr:hypothetical protein FXO37_30561 [Capsicum annuum]
MVDNTPMKMVTRSISRSDPNAHTIPTFDLGISQFEEEDALPSEEVRGIGHKRKVRDDVPTPDNDDDDLVKEKHCVSVPKIHFHLVENGKYKDYPWGKKAFKDLVKSISQKMDAQKQYYRIHGMPLAMQVWLYECCSAVDPKITVKHGRRILRLLNWETNNKCPHFEAFIEADVDNTVVYRNITATSREMEILQLPCVDAVEDTTSDDVSSDDDFQDDPPATGQNKGNKKLILHLLHHIRKHQLKKVMTQKTVPQRTLPKQPPILEKRKFIGKPPVKPKLSDVPTDLPFSSKSDEESILAKKFAIFQESDPNVEAEANIPTVPQSSPQDINDARFSVPNQFDTYTVELQWGHNVEAVEGIPNFFNRHLNILALTVLVLQSRVILVALSYNRYLKKIHIKCIQVIEDDGVAILGLETESQYEIPDELLPSLKLHINVIFYYLRKKGKYSPPSNYSYTTIDCVFKIKVSELWEKYVDPQSCTSSVHEEYIVCEYMNRYRLMAGVRWHTVDHVLIPLDCGIYIAAYAKFLNGGQGVPNQEFDIMLLRIRYASLLWDYDRKKKSGAMSDDEAP